MTVLRCNEIKNHFMTCSFDVNEIHVYGQSLA